MKTSDLNIFGGNENIMRAFEICHAGNFNMYLINSSDEDYRLSEKQFALLKNYLEPHVVEDVNKAHIIVEVIRPSITDILKTRHQETIMAVRIRATEAKQKATTLPEIFNDSSMALLKTAYERLGLMPYDIQIIMDVATTIAILDNPKTEEISVAHIAEAIQYRSMSKEQRES